VKQFVIVAVFAALLCGPAGARAMQQKDAQGTINVSPEEAKAYEPIEKAATAEASLAAAQAFMAKYPKSAALPQVEIAVYNKIIESPKDDKRIANIAAYKQAFPASERGLELERSMVDYHLEKGNLAEIKRVSDEFLARHPDDARTHYLLLRIAVDGLKRQDGSMIPSGQEHGKKAIAILEGTAKPAEFATDAEWQTWKTENLGLAYQSYGIIGLATGNMPMASEYIGKATVASPTDPLNYFFLANIREEEYAQVAQQFNSMADKKSPEATKTLEAANAKMDEVIKMLAKTVALSEDKPQYAQILAQAKPVLEERYKQRHGGKIDGLDAVIKAARESK
jgi:hypothetical protein